MPNIRRTMVVVSRQNEFFWTRNCLSFSVFSADIDDKRRAIGSSIFGNDSSDRRRSVFEIDYQRFGQFFDFG